MYYVLHFIKRYWKSGYKCGCNPRMYTESQKV